MENFKIAIGSKNKIKINATKHVVSKLMSDDVIITAIDVDSGISDNPTTHEEAIVGARNRALASCNNTNSQIGIGIEGNVFMESSIWFVTTWIVIVNKELRKEYIAQGISIPILDEVIIEQIDNSNPLGDILKKLPTKYEYQKYGNPMSFLTRGVFDRSRAISIALEACFSKVLIDL